MIVNYAKRLKAMLNREMSLQQNEKSLTKAHFQYSEKLEEVEQRYYEQNEKFREIKERLEKERQTTKMCEKLVAEGEALMAQLEATVKRRIAEAVQRQQQLSDQLAEIYSLKVATNTYVKLKALPERIQGVVVIETEESYKWRPFCVEPLSHSPEELKDIIWGDLEHAAEYSEAWERTVFRLVREELKKQQSQAS